MTLFDLHERALSDYRDFVRSFIQIAGNTAGLFCSKTAAASGLSPANGSDLHGAQEGASWSGICPSEKNAIFVM